MDEKQKEFFEKYKSLCREYQMYVSFGLYEEQVIFTNSIDDKELEEHFKTLESTS